MKSSSNQFTYANIRLIMVAALIALVTFAPGISAAADKVSHEDRTEMRIKDMHAKLKITAAQEGQWSKVAQVMHDNAKTMDSLIQARVAHAKDMTAVDDLKSYGEITDAHADGIKKLTPVFANLYDSMSDAQKKTADTFFRHGTRDHKHGHKTPMNK